MSLHQSLDPMHRLVIDLDTADRATRQHRDLFDPALDGCTQGAA